jgi:hypothetical protein
MNVESASTAPGSMPPESSAISPYTVDDGDAVTNAEAVLALWRNGLTHSGNPQAKLDWYYIGNVQGPPNLYFLKHKDVTAPVGVAAIGQREMRFNGATIRGGALVDFVTTPEHRTLFPALLLQKELRQKGLATHRVLYGLPNPKSLAVVRRAGYSLAGQMVRRARVLRSATYVARYLPVSLSSIVGPIIDVCRVMLIRARQLLQPSVRASWLETPDERFDALWQNAEIANVLMGKRDRAFLAWRFASSQMHSHPIFAITRNAGDKLIAYAVCEVQDQILHVRDFLCDSRMPNAMQILWAALITKAFKRGLAVISVEFLGSADIARKIEAAGLKPREQQPMYAAADPDWPMFLNENAWYLTSADKD